MLRNIKILPGEECEINAAITIHALKKNDPAIILLQVFDEATELEFLFGTG